ncbi:urea carboxylase [Moniliophthora roreri MCA 2997]|uniref:Urea carboxylase n=1 Tax=Moniliophthora roreri (strain MCA 2997) TaxID=1381753 RepID=V2XAC3_MONRO|nr:urea carboxylase [Moniliophthora roreri MCA 2997]
MPEQQKLLVANRGEIAVRIIRTAHAFAIPTVAIYTPSDALAPHVSLSEEAVALPLKPGESEFNTYRNVHGILSICKRHGVTLVHPGYGFISEDPEAGALFEEAGITWLGPTAEVIRMMGVKHEARAIAQKSDVPVVPGSEGILVDDENALHAAKKVGFPVILKATSGGGGMGMVICANEGEVKDKFRGTVERAKSLFGDGRVFAERYFPAARHIEIQIFGDGLGNVIHFGERECSVQRRHQKVIEETPSPFLSSHPGLREKMCGAAVRLGQTIKYSSAGTVEFIVDDNDGSFFFLEMNTRIQVEHPVTEAVHPGLDLVKLMIELGVAKRQGSSFDISLSGLRARGLDAISTVDKHAIEVRVYSENPFQNFKPCPGVLQAVDLKEGKYDWLRVDSWISTGTTISPFFDPLIAKLIVIGKDRTEALTHLRQVLEEIQVHGPPNNVQYLLAVVDSNTYQLGQATTQFLDTFKFTPRSFTVVSGGLDSTIQDYPGRTTGLGIPRSGPMDYVAFRVANILAGNPQATEGVEAIVIPDVELELHFHVETVIAVTGKRLSVFVNDEQVDMWSRIIVPADGKLLLQALPTETGASGLRSYLAVRGGFPQIPEYLNSKSTSMGLSGYQGRSLLPGDEIALADCSPTPDERQTPCAFPKESIPVYPMHWTIHVLPGPHGDSEYVTPAGIEKFYATKWKVAASSNRMGIRLDSPERIAWARENGGEGGSHPSNILDNGYALGTLNINGDTPVILTNEGPDMGGYMCFCTIASADLWKTGQLNPGSTVQFKRLTWEQARSLHEILDSWLREAEAAVKKGGVAELESVPLPVHEEAWHDPKLRVISSPNRPQVVFRQAGDSCILVEFGPMKLDFTIRARIHAFEEEVKRRKIPGVVRFCPCVRSTMCHYEPSAVSSVNDLVDALVDAEATLGDDMADMTFPGRRITFPVVLDDSWSRDAIARYMKATRSKAVYLPSNIEYLANNNGLDSAQEALRKLVGSDWVAFGVGFYLGCPFMVPVDPRCRLVGQKMNPSRTYTPRGAIGIAGVVAAIYPVESPGGYQLYGRTLPTWQTWGRGVDFAPDRPWLLRPFDQLRFEPISEKEYVEIEKDFDAGRYRFKMEDIMFSMKDYLEFIDSIRNEISAFKEAQAKAVAEVEKKEQIFLKEWEAGKAKASQTTTGDASASTSVGVSKVTSPLSASIWKIKATLGEEIQSASDVLCILEAMKTEIPITAGVKNVGKRIEGFGQGVKEGRTVLPGDILFLLK